MARPARLDPAARRILDDTTLYAEAPCVPVEELVEDARRLLKHATVDLKALTRVGLPRTHLVAGRALADELGHAQERLDLAIGRHRSKPARALDVQARDVRSALLAAARYALRQDTAALAIVSRFRDGEAVEDLDTDLLRLAEVLEAHPASFAQVGVKAPVAKSARQLAGRLTASRKREPTAVELTVEARASRNQVAEALTFVMSEVRQAGRYAFRSDRKKKAPYLVG